MLLTDLGRCEVGFFLHRKYLVVALDAALLLLAARTSLDTLEAHGAKAHGPSFAFWTVQKQGRGGGVGGHESRTALQSLTVILGRSFKCSLNSAKLANRSVREAEEGASENENQPE